LRPCPLHKVQAAPGIPFSDGQPEHKDRRPFLSLKSLMLHIPTILAFMHRVLLTRGEERVRDAQDGHEAWGRIGKLTALGLPVKAQEFAFENTIRVHGQGSGWAGKSRLLS
jgi:hypothetical protein